MSASRVALTTAFVLAVFIAAAPAGAREHHHEHDSERPEKTQGPLEVEVTYSSLQKVGEPVDVVVEAWNTDGEASEMKISVSLLDDGLRWLKGQRKHLATRTFARYEHQKLEFQVIPLRAGQSELEVDVSRTAKGETESRSLNVQFLAQ